MMGTVVSAWGLEFYSVNFLGYDLIIESIKLCCDLQIWLHNVVELHNSVGVRLILFEQTIVDFCRWPQLGARFCFIHDVKRERVGNRGVGHE